MHATLASAEYCPALHGTHGVAAVPSMSAVPAVQLWHAVRVILVIRPESHAAHGVEALESVSAVPATQSSHVVLPMSEYVPAKFPFVSLTGTSGDENAAF